MKNSDTLINDTLKDRATSFWLKNSLQTALNRDPVDAFLDAESLYLLLQMRVNEKLGGQCP